MDSTGTITYGRPTSATTVRRNSAEGGDSFGGITYPSNPYGMNTTVHRSSSFSDNLHAVATKEFVQPTNQEEEQLQMQIALAESQREVNLDKKNEKIIIILQRAKRTELFRFEFGSVRLNF